MPTSRNRSLQGLRLSQTPGEIRFTGRAHGADTETGTDTALCERLSLSSGRSAELRTAGAI
jgi:hypothetical protein